jgi:hypothetical protein
MKGKQEESITNSRKRFKKQRKKQRKSKLLYNLL